MVGGEKETGKVRRRKMKKKYLALSAGVVLVAAVLAVQIPGLVSAETQGTDAETGQEEEVITMMQKKDVVSFGRTENGTRLTLYDMKLDLPEDMVMETGVTEADTAFAFAIVDDLRLVLSAGESEVIEGNLADLSEEEQEAYREATAYEYDTTSLVESEIVHFNGALYAVHAFYEMEEEKPIMTLNTVVDGVSYTICGYPDGEMLDDTDISILTAMAAALEVDE